MEETKMSMSKKDFIALADAIRTRNEYADDCAGVSRFNSGHLAVLARFCKAQNPAFMEQRWLDYIAGQCGKNGGKIAA